MGIIKARRNAGFNFVSKGYLFVCYLPFFGRLCFYTPFFLQIVFPSGGELTVAVNGNRKEFLNIWYRAAADDYLNSEGE